jgi:hypothetical protein
MTRASKRYTTQQFNAVVSAIETDSAYPTVLTDLYGRLIAAAGYIMRQQAGIADDVGWSIGLEALPAFFTGLDRRQRRLIQRDRREPRRRRTIGNPLM